jgi:hypothetical protein
LHPDAGTMTHEEVGVTESDEGGDGQERKQKEEDTIAPGCLRGRYWRSLGHALCVGLFDGEDGARSQVGRYIHEVKTAVYLMINLLTRSKSIKL